MAGDVGVPAAGLELKLVLVNGKLEVRLRGPNVTLGYLNRRAVLVERLCAVPRASGVIVVEGQTYAQPQAEMSGGWS